MSAIDPIGFKLPEQQPPDQHSFSTRPRAVEEWVRGLPMAHVGETARLVFNALRELNRLKIGWQDRYRVLEAMRAPHDFVTTSLKRHFLGVPLPLPEKIKKVAQLAYELHSELALGYKIVVHDRANEGGSWVKGILGGRGVEKAVALHRAMHFQGRALLTAYQVYLPFKKDAWLELHRMYRYAEHEKLLDIMVDDEEHSFVPKTTVANAYKQILLLSLASPYRLRQGEAEAVYLATERWASHCHILTMADPIENALYLVRLDLDREPVALAFNRRDCTSDECRPINTHGLAAALRQEAQIITQGGKSPLGEKLGKVFTVDLLQRLLHSWGKEPKRAFTRLRADGEVELVVGISNLHRAISYYQHASLEEAMAERSAYDTKEVVNLNEDEEDVWDQVYTVNAAALTGEDEEDDQPAAPQFPIQNWGVVNESAGGFCLSSGGQETTGIQVGEIIGLRHVTRRVDPPWEIAVIRWVRHADNQRPADGEKAPASHANLEMGVQVLAPQAEPVRLRRAINSREYGEAQRCLLLAEIKPLHRPPTLVVPNILFKGGDKVLAYRSGAELKLNLNRLVEGTGSFNQFTFERVAEPVDTETAEPRGSGEQDGDFGNLWKIL